LFKHPGVVLNMSFSSELRVRFGKVRAVMRGEGVQALYSSDEAALRYLTGKDTGRLLVTGSGAVLWVKGVYRELYAGTYGSSGYPVEVREYDKDAVKDYLRGLGVRVLGVSSPALVDAGRKASRARVVVSDAVKLARAVKTKEEVRLIRKSCRIAAAGMRKAAGVVAEGVRELDAVAEIEAELRRRGSEAAPFGHGMLLSSGAGSADIHANPSARRIGRGPVVVDLGATYGGYYSDMTRTFGVGPLTRQERDVIVLVRRLRDDTIRMVRPGMLASTVHRSVELAITEAGFRFHHLSGHGVGLEIHEHPSFSPDNRVRLRPGMVFTVEPGIYLPGRFGVRFEDTVLLTRRGCVKLT